ncbi:protein-cysteine N-palmitoyltransferase HHAT-like [Ixodes scapularis]
MWITGILYVLWCYFASPANGNAPEHWPRAFAKSSYGLQRVQDDTNLSWNYGRSFLLSIWVWCLVQAAVSQALLQGNPRGTCTASNGIAGNPDVSRRSAGPGTVTIQTHENGANGTTFQTQGGCWPVSIHPRAGVGPPCLCVPPGPGPAAPNHCPEEARYIYQPLGGGGRSRLLRLVGTVASFSFVCVWHSMTRAVQIWCALSALGISLEIVTKAIRVCRRCQHLEATYLHGFRLRVLKAVLGSGLYLVSMFSCAFFLTNMEVGTIFFHKVILGFPLPIVPVLVFLYFASHVSLDAMDWETVPREASHSRPLPSS